MTLELYYNTELGTVIDRNKDARCIAICIAIRVFHIIYPNTPFGVSLHSYQGLWVRTSKLRCSSVPEERRLVLANSADPDGMSKYVAFHLDLDCLPKIAFRDIKG